MGGPAPRTPRFATNEMVMWSVVPEQELAVRFYAWRTITLSMSLIRSRAARVQLRATPAILG